MAKTDPNRNLVAALAYLLGFITGIIILLVEKDDKFIRFHAIQSTVIFGGLFIANIAFGIIFQLASFLGLLEILISNLILIVSLIIWAVSMLKAFQGEIFKWPLAGDFAEKRVK